MEKVVDVTIARRQLGTLLDKVFHRGDIFTIKRKGKVLAQIVPFKEDPYKKEKETISLRQKELLRELNSLPNIGINEDPVEILRNIRRQKRIEASNQYDK